jgi:hypothetical protein
MVRRDMLDFAARTLTGETWASRKLTQVQREAKAQAILRALPVAAKGHVPTGARER